MKLYWPSSEMPHGYLCDTPIHLVYRLKGCLPVAVLKELTAELVDQLVVLRKQQPLPVDQIEAVKAEYFMKYDELLDAQDQALYILANITAIKIVLDSWKTLHTSGDCKIHAVCVMGNHVHVILCAWPDQAHNQLGPLLARHKRFTNRTLQRAGFSPPNAEPSFWAEGFFDRYVRPGTYEVVFDYLLNNPVKAGLNADRRKWKGLWIP
ncbi:MAG: transposase [Saprospiraceae bacterium]